MRRAVLLLTPIAVLALATGSAAAATKVALTPRNGHPTTKFVVRFRNPAATGTVSSLNRIETLLVSGPQQAKRCVSNASIPLPGAAQGQRMRVTLNPKRFGDRWCVGRFHGWVTLRQRFVCGPPLAMVCPQLMVAPQTLARFSFRISRTRQRPSATN
ncbi:MAG TPA: hypothetical protein VGL51_00850 [Solirubrobacteraceae bacterium]|jgi:hypothetical protein